MKKCINKQLVYINQFNFEKAIEILKNLTEYRDAKVLLSKQIEYKEIYNNEKLLIDKALDLINSNESDYESKMLQIIGNYEDFKTNLQRPATVIYVLAKAEKHFDDYSDNANSSEQLKIGKANYLKDIALVNPFYKDIKYRQTDINNALYIIELINKYTYKITEEEWKLAYNNKDFAGVIQ